MDYDYRIVIRRREQIDEKFKLLNILRTEVTTGAVPALPLVPRLCFTS